MSEIVISSQLLKSPVSSVVTQIINFAQNNEPASVKQLMFQFFIHFLNKRHEVEVLLDDADEELDDLVLEVLESDQEELDIDVPAKGFLSSFIVELFVKNLITSDQLNCWKNFLKRCINHPDVRQNSSFKGRALLALSFMLDPLSKISRTIHEDTENLDVPENLLESIDSSIDDILMMTPQALKFKPVCMTIASTLKEAFEHYGVMFLETDGKRLDIYKEMLKFENTSLQITALKSLKNLCEIDDIRDRLREFFSSGATDEISFLELLNELMSRQGLKMDALSLLTEMSKIQKEINFSPEMRASVYSNILSTKKKLAMQTLELMKVLEEDFWPEIFGLLDSHDAKSEDFNRIIDITKIDIPAAQDLIKTNIGDPKKSTQSAKLFVELVKQNPKNQINYDELLQDCLENEKTFTILLDCFSVIDVDEFFGENAIVYKATFTVLLRAFEKFQSPLTLANIINVLKLLSNLSPEFALIEIKKIYLKYYNNFLQVFNEYENQRPLTNLFENPLKKLAFILENTSWNLVEQKHQEMIIMLVREIIGEVDDNLFPLIVRFHTNFLKHIWVRLMLHRDIPFTLESLVADIHDFTESLTDIIASENRVNNYVLASLLDLLVMFQPTEKLPQEFPIKINRENVKMLADKVAGNVFDGSAYGFERQLVMMSWIKFVKNYRNLPGQTTSEVILREYRMKSTVKSHIEILMDHLMTQKTILEQTVAFSILHFASNSDVTGFKGFLNAFEDFLSRRFPRDFMKQLTVLSVICSYIFSKLLVHLESFEEEKDRLLVLDFVEVMMKNMDTPMRQKLMDFLPENLILSEAENEKLEEFKKLAEN